MHSNQETPYLYIYPSQVKITSMIPDQHLRLQSNHHNPRQSNMWSRFSSMCIIKSLPRVQRIFIVVVTNPHGRDSSTQCDERRVSTEDWSRLLPKALRRAEGPVDISVSVCLHHPYTYIYIYTKHCFWINPLSHTDSNSL